VADRPSSHLLCTRSPAPDSYGVVLVLDCSGSLSSGIPEIREDLESTVRFSCTQQVWAVEALASGVFVNGRSLQHPHSLVTGDVILTPRTDLKYFGPESENTCYEEAFALRAIDPTYGVATIEHLVGNAQVELARARRHGSTTVAGVLKFEEPRTRDVIAACRERGIPNQSMGVIRRGELGVLFYDTTAAEARRRLAAIGDVAAAEADLVDLEKLAHAPPIG
jgi:hypothetical protein